MVDVISHTEITGDVVVAGNLDCNTMTTNSLEVKANINLYKVTYFDTNVLRRLDETDTALINFNELQCWVNGVNILVEYSELLTSYFANWTNKNIALAFRENSPVSNIYNNIIEADFVIHSVLGANAIIIKNIPLTNINNLQALVLYNRKGTVLERVLGLVFELYNSTNDTNLTTELANTTVITQAVLTYRYDFPSLDTYTGGFAIADSITEIASNTFALREDAM